MAIRVAINGFGRIGRNILRAHYTYKAHPEIVFVGINDLGDVALSAHLLRYDSTHGKFSEQVTLDDQTLVINQDRICMFSERDPHRLPWKECQVDVVLECTGRFTKHEAAEQHITAGAKRVLISAPGEQVMPTIVYGVNHSRLNSQDTIISNASCTTNCLACVIKPLHEAIGVISGFMCTVHAYTNDQPVLDMPHSDWRRARSAGQSIIPTKTGAAKAVGLVLPELAGKLDGNALRVPVANVSIVDLTCMMQRPTSIAEVNGIMEAAAQGALQGVLEINREPLVSVDFNRNPASAIFDTLETKVVNNMIKVSAWYDNEWGFSNRMLDVVAEWLRVA